MRLLICILALVLCLVAVAPASAADVVFLRTGLGIVQVVEPTNALLFSRPVLAIQSPSATIVTGGQTLALIDSGALVVAERKRVKVIVRPRPVVIVK